MNLANGEREGNVENLDSGLPTVIVHRSILASNCPYDVKYSREAWAAIFAFVGITASEIPNVTVELKRRAGRRNLNTTGLHEKMQDGRIKITIFTDPFWDNYQYFENYARSRGVLRDVGGFARRTTEEMISHTAAHEGKHEADRLNKSPAFLASRNNERRILGGAIVGVVLAGGATLMLHVPLIGALGLPTVYGISRLIHRRLYKSDPLEISANQAIDQIEEAIGAGKSFPIVTLTPKTSAS